MKSDEEKKQNVAVQLGAAPIKCWVDENEKVRATCKPNTSGPDAINAISGTKDYELSYAIVDAGAKALSSAVSGVGDEIRQLVEGFNVIVQSLHDFQPQDAIEARLVSQAAVAYGHAMSLVKKGAEFEMLCHLEALSNLAIKFMRVHNERPLHNFNPSRIKR